MPTSTWQLNNYQLQVMFRCFFSSPSLSLSVFLSLFVHCRRPSWLGCRPSDLFSAEQVAHSLQHEFPCQYNEPFSVANILCTIPSPIVHASMVISLYMCHVPSPQSTICAHFKRTHVSIHRICHVPCSVLVFKRCPYAWTQPLFLKQFNHSFTLQLTIAPITGYRYTSHTETEVKAMTLIIIL